MENRRRAERQPSVWIGTCHIEGDSSDLWRDCGVFDFSTLGAGMDVRYPEPSELVGRHVSIRLPVGGSLELTLTGPVRNTQPGPDGVVRTGIEFVGLTDIERAVIDLLERDGPMRRPNDD